MKINFDSIFNIGLNKINSVKENKRIKLLNFFCFTWCLMIPTITLFDLFFKRELKSSLVLHGISYVIIFFIFYFQKKRYYIIARVLFLSAIIVITYVFSNYTTPLNLIENFYFIYPLVALILIEEKWINISILILCFILYFVPNLYFKHYPEGMILPILVFCAFSGAFIILNYSDSINRKNEKELLKNKKELQQAYLELEEAKKIELSNFQLKALKAQMNPHFLFNAINSIQNLILKDNKQEAYNYLTKFSSLMRDNLNTSEKSFVSFKKELSMLKKYLELEKLRFGALFTYQIIGTEKIENIEIPSMVIQPFIENSLRYSLLHKKEGSKKISIDFFQEDFLKCIIEDNGIGFEALKNIKNIHQSKVVTNSLNDNINKRLVLLKELYNIEIDYTYEDVIEGTRVILKIPFTK